MFPFINTEFPRDLGDITSGTGSNEQHFHKVCPLQVFDIYVAKTLLLYGMCCVTAGERPDTRGNRASSLKKCSLLRLAT